MPAIPEFSQAELESICSILGDTREGLTDSEIGGILVRLGIPDPMPKISPHCPKLRLLVRMMLRSSYLWEMSAVGVHGDIAELVDDEQPGDNKVPRGGAPSVWGTRCSAIPLPPVEAVCTTWLPAWVLDTRPPPAWSAGQTMVDGWGNR